MINLDKYISPSSAVLVITRVNRRYITGFDSSLGYLLMTSFGNYLFVDSRYFEAAKNIVKDGTDVILLERFSKQFNEYIKKFNIKTVFTETDITVAEYEAIKGFSNAAVFAEPKLSEKIIFHRSIKTDAEVDNITKAQRIAEKAFEEVKNFIKVGVSEREIALFLDSEMRKNGSEGVSFDTIALCSKNTSLPHGVPGDSRVKEGDFVLMDFGAVYNGCHSDMTRTVAVGRVSEKQKRVYDIVLNAQNAALNTLKYGISAYKADAAARKVIADSGFSEFFGHSTGHGVGLEIHECPNLSPNNQNALFENQVVTVEPGIYLPGEFGVRIEDMAVIKRNGCINLTNADKSLIII